MKEHQQRSSFAQHRIDYIVYHRPELARQLAYDLGYEVPENVHDLVDGMKELVRQKEPRALEGLLQLHPDRKAILDAPHTLTCASCQKKLKEDGYCGCGESNYSDENHFLKRLREMTPTELRGHYDELLEKANLRPDDKALSEELQTVWNEVRQLSKEKKQPSKASKDENQPTENRGSSWFDFHQYWVIGLTLVAGVVIGTTLFKQAKHGVYPSI